MGLNIIKFEDKVSLKNNPVADINKATAGDLNEIKKAINDLIFPIGCIIINSDSEFDPNLVYGGKWERELMGMFPVGYDPEDKDLNEIGKKGGAKSVVLTTDEIPSHRHQVDGNWAYDKGASGWGSPMSNSDGYVFEPKHLLSSMASVGGDKPHNNMPPYQVVAYWKRVE